MMALCVKLTTRQGGTPGFTRYNNNGNIYRSTDNASNITETGS